MIGETSFRLEEVPKNLVGTFNSKRNKDFISAVERGVERVENKSISIVKANEITQGVFIECCQEGVFFLSLDDYFTNHLYSTRVKCKHFSRIQNRLADYETFYNLQAYTLKLYNNVKSQLRRLNYLKNENIQLKYSLSKMSRKK